MTDGDSKTACFALLEALNPERSPDEREELLLTAIGFAMASTGHRLRDKPGAAAEMLKRFYEMIRAEAPTKRSIW